MVAVTAIDGDGDDNDGGSGGGGDVDIRKSIEDVCTEVASDCLNGDVVMDKNFVNSMMMMMMMTATAVDDDGINVMNDNDDNDVVNTKERTMDGATAVNSSVTSDVVVVNHDNSDDDDDGDDVLLFLDTNVLNDSGVMKDSIDNDSPSVDDVANIKIYDDGIIDAVASVISDVDGHTLSSSSPSPIQDTTSTTVIVQPGRKTRRKSSILRQKQNEEKERHRRHVVFALPKGSVECTPSETHQRNGKSRNVRPIVLLQRYRDKCHSLVIDPLHTVIKQLAESNRKGEPLTHFELMNVSLSNKSWQAINDVILYNFDLCTVILENVCVMESNVNFLVKALVYRKIVRNLSLASNKKLGKYNAFRFILLLLTDSHHLNSLNLSGVCIDRKSATNFTDALRSNFGLKHLCLNNCGLKDLINLEFVLNGVTENTCIETLDMTHNDINCQGAKLFVPMLQFNLSLTTLDIGHNNIKDLGAQFIADILCMNHHIVRLNMENNGITSIGLGSISQAVMVNRTLQSLDLSYNSFGKKDALSHLKHALSVNTVFRELSLCYCGIVSEGAIALAEGIAESQSISYLNLLDNSIGEAGLLALELATRINQSLVKLDVNDNKTVYTELEQHLIDSIHLRCDSTLKTSNGETFGIPKEVQSDLHAGNPIVELLTMNTCPHKCNNNGGVFEESSLPQYISAGVDAAFTRNKIDEIRGMIDLLNEMLGMHDSELSLSSSDVIVMLHWQLVSASEAISAYLSSADINEQTTDVLVLNDDIVSVQNIYSKIYSDSL